MRNETLLQVVQMEQIDMGDGRGLINTISTFSTFTCKRVEHGENGHDGKGQEVSIT